MKLTIEGTTEEIAQFIWGFEDDDGDAAEETAPDEEVDGAEDAAEEPKLKFGETFFMTAFSKAPRGD